MFCTGDNKVVMEADRFSYETKMLASVLCGYNQENRLVVSFDEDNACIQVAPDGMSTLNQGEKFHYHCQEGRIIFTTGNQTVMEMAPVFDPDCLEKIQIKGWIYESYLEYLDYLSAIMGYAMLAAV